jgi:hypothetical protein
LLPGLLLLQWKSGKKLLQHAERFANDQFFPQENRPGQIERQSPKHKFPLFPQKPTAQF